LNTLLKEFGLAGPDLPTLRKQYCLSTSSFVRCMGMDVHVSIEGSGPDVVMIHGFAASLHTWEETAGELCKQFRVIRFDLPPFGLTGPSLDEKGFARKMDVAFYQRFVDAVLDALSIRKCVMIGNSFGGFLGWDQAVRHPERVRGLVISDAVGYQQPLPIYIRLFTFKPIAWLTRYTIPAFLLRMAVRDVYGDKTRIRKEVMNRYLELFMYKPNRSAVGNMVGVFTEGELGAERLADIQCKTLIVWGDKDRWVSIDMASRFHQDIRNAELKIYRGAGHIPMEECPDRFAADCVTFIETL
jgi:pimeloyl-ACP methyl ester carboxylesterase